MIGTFFKDLFLQTTSILHDLYVLYKGAIYFSYLILYLFVTKFHYMKFLSTLNISNIFLYLYPLCFHMMEKKQSTSFFNVSRILYEVLFSTLYILNIDLKYKRNASHVNNKREYTFYKTL